MLTAAEMKPGDDSARYTATVRWERRGAVFTDSRYSRGHHWEFDGGVRVPASASPHSVPLPLSVAEAVDPEEAFIAAVASCHMLWFLSIAAGRGFVVEAYRDEAWAAIGRGAGGGAEITDVFLRPRVQFAAGGDPGPAGLAELHHAAHARCLIANSIRSEVHIEGA
jgi:organic hydroperoxide reductase OsmC/OhrA